MPQNGEMAAVDPSLVVNLGIFVVTAAAAAFAWVQARTAVRARQDASEANDAARDHEAKALAAAEKSAANEERAVAAAVEHLEVVRQAEQRRQEIDDRWQAERVSVLPGDGGKVIVGNSSASPIYDVFVVAGIRNQDGAYGFLPQYGATGVLEVPPGRWTFDAPPYQQASGMSKHSGIAITFRDIRGMHWMLDASGRITRLDGSGAEVLGIQFPFTYAASRRVD